MFWNRIKTDQKFLKIDSPRYVISPKDSQFQVLIKSTGDTLIEDTHDLILVSDGYPDIQTAYENGKRWRQMLSVFFARIDVSLDLGDDSFENIDPPVLNWPPDIRQQFGVPEDITICQDSIRLHVVEANPKRQFFYATADLRVLTPITDDKVAHLTRSIERNHEDWSDELTLAYKLFHAALSEANAEAKYILMVTALEALIPFAERGPNIVDILDTLIEWVNDRIEMPAELRDVIVRLLEGDKKESVRSFGLQLADRLTDNYDGKAPRKFFDEIYGTRSALAHGNLRNFPKYSETALHKQMGEVKRFVLDVLDAWTPDFSGNGSKLA